MSSLDTYAQRKLGELEERHLKRALFETSREDGIWVTRGGRRYLSFSCNDYLNLTHHPKVKKAATEAVWTYGAGAGASRLVTGNHPLVVTLENRLAQFKGTEAACVFGSGYLANAGTIPTLIGAHDLLLIDELAHACLFAGGQLARGTMSVFRHNDVEHLRSLLTEGRKAHAHALIVSDGVFSMDGDVAPIEVISHLAREFNAWLMLDDAHGLGVLGEGRGSAFDHGSSADIGIQMGTLSKALGSYGGYVCASRSVIDLIKTRARTLVYSTSIPPASAAAAIAALEIVRDDPGLCALPLQKASLFTSHAKLPQAQSAIVPLVLGDPRRALDAQRVLEELGFLVVAIRPPTVPPRSARLRFAFTAGHPDEEIARLARAVRERILAD